MVFAKDIAAQYLEPYEDGGPQFLGAKRAILAPVAQRTNQYGNLPRTALVRLKAKPNVFTGKHRHEAPARPSAASGSAAHPARARQAASSC